MSRHLLAVLLLLSPLTACVVESAAQRQEEEARQKFLAQTKTARFTCEIDEALFFAGKERASGQPFRVELACRNGVRKTFTLHGPDHGQATNGGFFFIEPHEEAGRPDVPELDRLLKASFASDPWLASGGTFDTWNAVGRGSEIAILGFIVASFLLGLLYVLRARPEAKE